MILSIAIRNLSRQKRRTLLLGGAIAFGVLIITLLTSFTDGLVSTVRQNIFESNGGDLYLAGREAAPGRVLAVIRDPAALEAAVAASGLNLRALTRRSSAPASVTFGSKTRRLTLLGVETSNEHHSLERLVVREGRPQDLSRPDTIVLSPEAAKKLRVGVGESVLVTVNTISGQQNVVELTVVALASDPGFFGLAEAHSLVPLETLNRLLDIGAGQYQTLAVALSSPEGLEDQAAVLSRALAAAGLSTVTDEAQESWSGTRYRLSTLADTMGPVLAIISALRVVSGVVFVVLVTITMVGISNTFRMILMERTREIGTLRALGLQKSQVRDLFLLEALVIALGGILVGVAASLVVAVPLGAVPWQVGGIVGSFLRSGHLHLAPAAATVALELGLVTLMSLLAAAGPANKAAAIEPALALRTQY